MSKSEAKAESRKNVVVSWDTFHSKMSGRSISFFICNKQVSFDNCDEETKDCSRVKTENITIFFSRIMSPIKVGSHLLITRMLHLWLAELPMWFNALMFYPRIPKMVRIQGKFSKYEDKRKFCIAISVESALAEKKIYKGIMQGCEPPKCKFFSL